MQTIIISIFFILHGMIHLLYFGHSQRFFELRSGMVWPDGSWTFSKLLGDETTRLLASVSLVLSALGFVVAGVGLFIRQDWWHSVVLVSAAASTLLFILFWDGKFQALDEKGGVAILINLAILAAVLILRWPS